MSAASLRALLLRKKVSSPELIELLLGRIDAINPAVNAIVSISEEARSAAEESQRRLARGEARSALEGLPITVKDNVWVRGIRATWGSRLFARFVPIRDELPVSRLRAAGAVILGKTNLPEFALDGYTSNPIFGVTRNPWDPDLTPGGSSGGAVSSVASGLTPFAIGTDGGGSIRRPASYTGLVGLKPSIGSVARVGGFPQILLDFEVVGPIARTVGDAAMAYAVLAGPDDRDRRSLLFPAKNGVDLSAAPGRLRILHVPRFGDSPVQHEIRESVATAAENLRALGHRVVDGAPPFSAEEANTIFDVVSKVGVARVIERNPEGAHDVAPRLMDKARQGANVTASRYLEVIERIGIFRRHATASFEDVDVIMTPSAAAMPWPAEDVFPPEIDGTPVGPRGHAAFTGWVNVCGHPAVGLPAPPSPSGLPIGFQLVGRFGADNLLLRLARQYEAAYPWAQRWPALASLQDAELQRGPRVYGGERHPALSPES